MKLLAIGDIHLGRRPSHLPGALQDRSRELGPAAAWRRCVETACAEQVDIVALAGDVVEREDDFFEAYRILRDGVKQLHDAGIQVVAVAGNHDVRVLPRLADEIPGFRLLGRGGQWEPFQHRSGRESLTLWGWSFPQPQVTTSPLAQTRPERQPGGPNLGLLHCDLDQSGSRYGPVSSSELAAAGLDGWLLGHIHKPGALSADHLTGYLGSVTGMDPGEPGPHGPWRIAIRDGRIHSVVHLTLAPLRWETLDVDLSGISEAGEAHARLLDALRRLDDGLAAGEPVPDAVGVRITLCGTTALGEAALELLGREDLEHVYQSERDSQSESDSHYFINRLELATRPEIPLAELAARDDPAGLLAKQLLLLERPESDRIRQKLITGALDRLKARALEPTWQDLQADEPDQAQIAEWLRVAGSRLLERMLAQHEPGE